MHAHACVNACVHTHIHTHTRHLGGPQNNQVIGPQSGTCWRHQDSRGSEEGSSEQSGEPGEDSPWSGHRGMGWVERSGAPWSQRRLGALRRLGEG